MPTSRCSGHDYTQEAVGVDGDARAAGSSAARPSSARWRLPAINAPFIDVRSARAGYVEGRYRFGPRVFAAMRVDALSFTRISGQRLFGGQPTTWDAPVSRIELGGGVNIQRNLTARAVVQHNWRDGGRVKQATYVSAQLAYWF
jgi:hypothetical protein